MTLDFLQYFYLLIYMDNIIYVIICFGVVFITIIYTKESFKCPQPQIIYRYIPRSLIESQNNPVSIADNFSGMFEKESPWIGDNRTFYEYTKKSIK